MTMQPQKPHGTQASKSAEIHRKKVLVDGNSVELARQLGITPEEYVDHVVGFFLHAREEPALYVVKDEDPRATGHQEPPETRASSTRPEVRSAPQRKVG
jgi:hypothetical protein